MCEKYNIINYSSVPRSIKCAVSIFIICILKLLGTASNKHFRIAYWYA